jgi:adenylate cyclase
MSETRPAQEIVTLLNEYFEVMVEQLFRFEGTLDKFVGDEIMALFGAPLALKDAPLQAVVCAIEMNRVLDEFNRTRLAERQEPIRVGIGINTGQVVTGAIGSSRAIQYTAIGDPVNTASRLCNLAKPGEILVTETTMKRIAGKVDAQSLGEYEVKNKREKLRVYNVLGLKGQEAQRDYTKPM